MYSFICDYSEGAHPNILKALSDACYEQNEGYNYDQHCLRAAKRIKEEIKRDDVDVYFLPGGTPTNLISITACLRSYEAIIAPSTGHIEVHETGAIEATGHKILPIDSPDGKLTPSHIQKILNGFEDEHTVRRKMVFLTNPTENGTIYKKAELQAIRKICDDNDMYLYIDGARLGCAIMAEGNDVKMEDLPEIADIFYIGGTKNGALMAEALIIVNDKIKPDFRFHIKQRGALTAKGSVLGIQFEELMRDNLYFKLAKHSNEMAQKLAKEFERLGFSFLTQSPTNQIFPILPNSIISELEKSYQFYIWQVIDQDHSAIRLVTSWATPEEKVDQFIKDLKQFL
ncbi:MAG: aminotransferase class I/II-fold pyridoxal phosphate-dependent enzyme [Anaerovorax sp.]|nr:aminotransferase class I/II-fold pyridoxal phosphate-dependent enzyme [Anaerovorax sp.]